MADVTWTPPYPTWHDYNVSTGTGIPDTPIDSVALADLVAGIRTAIAQANAALRAAGVVIVPSGTPAGFVLTVQSDGSVLPAASTGGGGGGSVITPNYDGTATVTGTGSTVTLTPNLDGTDLFAGSGVTPNNDGTILLTGSNVTPNHDGTISTL